MIKMPSPQQELAAKRNDMALEAEILVTTTTDERHLRLIKDTELFEEAARKALTEAATAGLEYVTFKEVTTYIFTEDNELRYRQAWTFTAPLK